MIHNRVFFFSWSCWSSRRTGGENCQCCTSCTVHRLLWILVILHGAKVHWCFGVWLNSCIKSINLTLWLPRQKVHWDPSDVEFPLSSAFKGLKDKGSQGQSTTLIYFYKPWTTHQPWRDILTDLIVKITMFLLIDPLPSSFTRSDWTGERSRSD